MTLEEIKSHALRHKGAEHLVQWRGSQVYKVGGKVFAIHGPESGHVTVKCDHPETAQMLIEMGVARRAPHLPRGGWVAFDVATTGVAELEARITLSYEKIFSALPKATQKDIGGNAL